MGLNAFISILFIFAGIYVFASEIPFNQLIEKGALEQKRLAAADITETKEDPILLNVQKKETATAELHIDENNDGLKIVLKKMTKNKKKKKPASVSSPIIVPIYNN